MANLQPMRYKDYVWPHNPRTYTITYRRAMAVTPIPYGFYTMESLGQTHRVMTGQGEFVGPGAYEEFKRLASVYYTGSEGILVHPCWQSAHVFFVGLSLTEVPRPDYVAYTFEFWEAYDHYDMTLKKVPNGSSGAGASGGGTGSSAASVYHTVVRGDTLWSIARSRGLSLEALLAMNTSIKNPNLIYVGQKVRVA